MDTTISDKIFAFQILGCDGMARGSESAGDAYQLAPPAQEMEGLRGMRERAAEEQDQYVAGALKFDEEGHERLIREASQMDAILKGDHVSLFRT